MRIRTIRNINNKYSSNTLLKSKSCTLTGINSQQNFQRKKYIVLKSQMEKKRPNHKSFYQINIEKVLHLNPDDCKNDLRQSKLTTIKGTNRKLVNFQLFPESAHQSKLERYLGHKKLDEKYPFHGAHGRLTYDLHNKSWIPDIGIKTLQIAKQRQKNDFKK